MNRAITLTTDNQAEEYNTQRTHEIVLMLTWSTYDLSRFSPEQASYQMNQINNR